MAADLRTLPRAEGRPATRTWWIDASFLIAGLALAGSVLSLADADRYAGKTPNWAAQAVGQDIANLVVYPAMVVLAIAARRRSARAYLGWLGTLGFSAYSYAIFAFDVRFGSLFLLYVTVLGLSVLCLIEGVAQVDPDRSSRWMDGWRVRTPAYVTAAIGAIFVVLWLVELIPATVTGRPPQAVLDSGLPTNPVHVIDLAIFLPAAIAAGVLAAKGRAVGVVFVPVVLTTMVELGLAILVSMAVASARSLDAPVFVAVVVGLLTAIESAALVRSVRAVDPTARRDDVVRRPLS